MGNGKGNSKPANWSIDRVGARARRALGKGSSETTGPGNPREGKKIPNTFIRFIVVNN